MLPRHSKILICTALLLASLQATAISLRFMPVAGSKALVLDDGLYSAGNGKDSMRISTFRFYISGILLLQDGRIVWTESNSYHLVDAAEPGSLAVPLSTPADIKYNQVRFCLGIDSTTNAAGAQGGDLDAINGMYWAWQSGYINMKLEGSSPQCRTRKHEFQFHIGGFMAGDYCLQQLILPVDNSPVINVQVDAAAFIKELDLQKQAIVMNPGPEAVMLSGIAKKMFRIMPAQK